MTDSLISAAKEQVAALTQSAYEKAAAAGELPAGAEVRAKVDIPKDVSHGDYASSFAMAAAKALGKPPREIAQILMSNMDLSGSYFDKVELAGPGFLNFTLGKKWYGDVLSAVETEGMNYGASDIGKGEKVMVEFVSANPTGTMTIGNARGGVLGDATAAILDRLGYDVWREFYVNDTGNQIDKFAKSLDVRYIQLIKGEDAAEFPEDGYHGDDIKELAKEFRDTYGDSWLDKPEAERQDAMRVFGLERNIARMKADLERYNIHFDQWFLESSLHESGFVADTMKVLGDAGYLYEKDGAIWLENTKFGADKDEVLRRANGFYTYYASDIAYHRNKFLVRGFDRVINVWGADHHGHAIRFAATMKAPALGLEGKKLDILLMQLVELLQDGQEIRVSKRSGKAISLADLLDEIGVDAARFFFSNSKPTSHLVFDMGLAKRQDSENPVYYVQYAHARICSLVAKLTGEEGMVMPAAADVDASLLNTPEELALLKTIARFPDEIKLAGRDYDPSQINRYLIALAADFHRFYNTQRIKGEAPELAAARLKLADTTRSVLANGLNLLGISAPEKM
ncbi:MAG: arginine--tRNA ligase [Candidatus Enterenecus sp.]